MELSFGASHGQQNSFQGTVYYLNQWYHLLKTIFFLFDNLSFVFVYKYFFLIRFFHFDTSQKPVVAPKPSMPASKPAMPSSPARKAKSVGERPSQLPIAAGSPAVEGHDESPEKLSLKARLKLFEKEIEQQGNVAPAPKPGLTLFYDMHTFLTN